MGPGSLPAGGPCSGCPPSGGLAQVPLPALRANRRLMIAELAGGGRRGIQDAGSTTARLGNQPPAVSLHHRAVKVTIRYTPCTESPLRTSGFLTEGEITAIARGVQ